MQNQKLKGMLNNPEVNPCVARFARYICHGLDHLSNGNGAEFDVNEIYNQVRINFLRREARQDKPFWEDYTPVQLTHFFVDGLTLLEQKGMIFLNEETGKYKRIRSLE